MGGILEQHCPDIFAFGLNEYGYCGTTIATNGRDLCEMYNSNVPCLRLSDTPVTSQSLTYDLGVDYLTEFMPADLLVVQDAINFLDLDASFDIVIESSDDNFATISETETLTVTDADLKGVLGRDYYSYLFNFPNRRRYWRLTFVTATPINPSLGNISFGQKFTFLKAPAYPLRGQIFDRCAEAKRNLLQLTLKFEGVTPEKKEEFDRRILAFENVIPVWLIDAENKALFNKEIIRMYFIRQAIDIRAGGYNYSVEINLEEVMF